MAGMLERGPFTLAAESSEGKRATVATDCLSMVLVGWKEELKENAFY